MAGLAKDLLRRCSLCARGADVIKVTATGGVLSNVNAGTGQQFTDEELRAIADTAHALGRQPKDMTRLAHQLGVKIALGTDSGVSPNGENANEFVEYVNIGMTPMQALVAGTVDAARAGGFEQVGSLEPGKAADLVAMQGNPLDDIRAVLGVHFVMRDGIVFKGEAR